MHATVGAIIESYQNAFGLSLGVSPDEAAIVFASLIDGFSLHKLADPDHVDDALLSRAFTWLAHGLLADAQARSTAEDVTDAGRAAPSTESSG